MVARWPDGFCRDAMTSGLTRPQAASDSRGGLSTLGMWAQKHQHDDLMSDLPEDVEKQSERLRNDVRLLREEKNVLKSRSGLSPACAR
jgi:transposase